MERKNQPLKAGRRRKVLLVLPLLLLPFVTMLFWALGGGKAESATVQEVKGFNLNLPNAKNTDNGEVSKLNYYESAALDSAKIEELRRKDPNYRSGEFGDAGEDSLTLSKQMSYNSRGLNVLQIRDPNEEKVYQRLEALKKAIAAPHDPRIGKERDAGHPGASNMAQADIQRLEGMMASLGTEGTEDKELQQINGMLENILDIQYPGRMEQKLRDASRAERGKVFSLGSQEKQQAVHIIESAEAVPAATFGTGATHNRFYSLDDQPATDTGQNAVRAVIAETQTVVNGSTIKLRLRQDVFINGAKIPQNTFVYGVAALKGERLTVKVNSIRWGNSLFPVDLSVFDLDGLDGIYIPGAINRDVAKTSADRSMQTLGVTTLDDSWGAQAAGAGIEAAKTLFSKKVKLIKVVVKAGYEILLRDEQNED